MWEVLHPGPNARGDNTRVAYTADVLLQQLMQKILDVPSKEDQELLVKEILHSLKAEALIETTPAALIETGFRLGYLYRVFLERNDVICPRSPEISESSTTTGDSN